MLSRPQEAEFNPYYQPYISVLPDGDVITILEQQQEKTEALLAGISESQSFLRYEPGKWSLKEVVGHMADTERIMAYRLLTIARGGTDALPGFDQNSYVDTAGFDNFEVAHLVANLNAVRDSTITLLRCIPDDAWTKSAPVSGHETTVRALAYIIAGHELHHLRIIEERYLPALQGK